MRRSKWRPAPCLGALLLAAIMLVFGGRVQAQEALIGAWQPTGLADGEPVQALFTPASGALFALTGRYHVPGAASSLPRFELGGLLRSDDAGLNWRVVPLPPEGDIKVVEVDPADHTILYAVGHRGVYKTVDDAASWQLIYSAGGATGWSIAVSPADHEVVYLHLDQPLGPPLGAKKLLRSRDGGRSWDDLGGSDGIVAGCSEFAGPTWPTLRPHPADPTRLFVLGHCNSPSLRSSADRGDHWSTPLVPAGQATYVVGGSGAIPWRFYLTTHQPGPRIGPGAAGRRCCDLSRLFRSDDDGQTWAEMLAGSEQDGRNFATAALAYDPADPDRLYIGGGSAEPGVRVSLDGGETWADLGGLGRQVSQLALGVDGRYLYAVSGGTVYRLSLP